MTRDISNLPINIQDKIRAEVEDMKNRVAASGTTKIRANGSRGFILPDGNEVSELEVVIIDFASVNSYFDRVYSDKDESPKIPACAAYGPDPAKLVPYEDAAKRQSESCKTCPMNQFGSAPNGTAKACKNTRVVAVMPVSIENGADPTNTPIWYLSVPPGSLSYFDKYVTNLANRLNATPTMVVTKISAAADSTYYAPRFDAVRPLNSDDMTFYFGFKEEAAKMLEMKPDFSQYQEPKRR